MISVSSQLAGLALVAGAGGLLGLLWDIYRVAKAALGIRRTLTVALCDATFGVVCGLVAFMLLLVANGAELRLSTLIGLGAGLAIYRWTVSPFAAWALWGLASFAVGALRAGVAILWWVARRPRPWGTL